MTMARLFCFAGVMLVVVVATGSMASADEPSSRSKSPPKRLPTPTTARPSRLRPAIWWRSRSRAILRLGIVGERPSSTERPLSRQAIPSTRAILIPRAWSASAARSFSSSTCQGRQDRGEPGVCPSVGEREKKPVKTFTATIEVEEK